MAWKCERVVRRYHTSTVYCYGVVRPGAQGGRLQIRRSRIQIRSDHLLALFPEIEAELSYVSFKHESYSISLYFEAIVSKFWAFRFFSFIFRSSHFFPPTFFCLFVGLSVSFLLVEKVSALTSRKVNFLEEKCQWWGRSIFLPFSQHKFEGLLPLSLAQSFPWYSFRHAFQELFLLLLMIKNLPSWKKWWRHKRYKDYGCMRNWEWKGECWVRRFSWYWPFSFFFFQMWMNVLLSATVCTFARIQSVDTTASVIQTLRWTTLTPRNASVSTF